MSSPAIGADGTVYLGAVFDDKLYALDGKTGAKKWEFKTGYDVTSSPAIGTDGTVYVGASEKFYALNGTTGAKKWEFRFNHRHGDLYKTLLKTSKSTPLSSQAPKRKGSGSIARHDHKPSEKCCEPHLFNPVAHIHSRALLEYTGGLKQSQ
jgi:hypothetical protein